MEPPQSRQSNSRLNHRMPTHYGILKMKQMNHLCDLTSPRVAGPTLAAPNRSCVVIKALPVSPAGGGGVVSVTSRRKWTHSWGVSK